MTVSICVEKGLPKNAIIVEAFPSRGYVSTLAANHMIRRMGMEQVGWIECDKLDAVAVVHDGRPMHPIRVYHKDNLIVVFSELIIPFNLVHEFTTALGDWFKALSPKTVILLASLPGIETHQEHEIQSVSTDREMAKKLEKLGIKEMKEGVLTGMSSSLMIKCCGIDLPATSLMIETNYIPDVLASAALLKILAELLSLDLDVDELIKTGNDIEAKFKVNLEQMKKGQENYKEMHAQLPMYR